MRKKQESTFLIIYIPTCKVRGSIVLSRLTWKVGETDRVACPPDWGMGETRAFVSLIGEAIEAAAAAAAAADAVRMSISGGGDASS